MNLIVGTWDPAWGHTWVEPGFGKLYALRSLAGGSALVVMDTAGNAMGEYPTPGEHSCHITLLSNEAVVADYTSGTLSLYPLDTDGLPSREPEVIHFQGRGPHPLRQQGPHIHSSWVSPDGACLVVADLGSDRLYRFRVSEGRLSRDGMEVFPMPAGCGPRHCAFGNGVLYVSTELSDEVLVLDWPSMKLIQRCVVNEAQPGGGGHLLLSPDGKYLYASSRLKNDGIASFKVLEGGALERTGYFRTGSHPRHFCMSPEGDALLVACRDNDRVQLFFRDPLDGSLSLTEQALRVEKPVFVRFICPR